MCYIWDGVGCYITYGPLLNSSAAHSSRNGFLDTANLTKMHKDTSYAAYHHRYKKFCNVNVGI
jgi:hypothetical protein